MENEKNTNEKVYRERVQVAFKAIEKAFENIDPDLAEFDYSQGSLTVQYSNGSKLILSQQPSVRQIWVAAASKGVAHHLSYDEVKGQWLDDKNLGIELYQFISSLTKEVSGAVVQIQP